MSTTFQQRLKDAMYKKDINQTELAKMVGVSGAAISKYISGQSEPGSKNMKALSDALGVSLEYLYGYEDEPTESAPRPQRRSLPVLGKIACGEPIYDDGNIEFYFDPQNPVDADFCLIAEGDSMIGVHIQEGDIVFIRSQPMVDNGQIAAVRIGDEYTLKRFYWDRLRSVVQLNAENPSYPPIIKTGAEIDEVDVVGLVVGFQHSFVAQKKTLSEGQLAEGSKG